MADGKESGSCLCGAVRFTAEHSKNTVGACHCEMCRKWGGGPFMAVHVGTDISFEGDENITVFDSSTWADRGFCKKCGSHLFYRVKGPKQYYVPAGLFDDAGQLEFDYQVFIDEKPAFYAFAGKTTNMTGAEVFAKFGPSADE